MSARLNTAPQMLVQENVHERKSPSRSASKGSVSYEIFARNRNTFVIRKEGHVIGKPELLTEETIQNLQSGETVRILTKNMSRVQMASIVKAIRDGGKTLAMKSAE